MANLRNLKIKEIKDVIVGNHHFSLDDFEIKFPENAYQLATITFIAMPKYSFSIEENRSTSSALSTLGLFSNSESKKPDKELKTIESPGEYKNLQITDHNDIDDCIEHLNGWLNRLHVDLQYVDHSELSESITDEFLSKLDGIVEDPEEKFATEEKEHILNVLNELQERVKQLEDAQKLSTETANQTKSVIEASKITLETYPKKAWIITTYNKLKNINDMFKTAIEFKEHFGKMLEWGNGIQ